MKSNRLLWKTLLVLTLSYGCGPTDTSALKTALMLPKQESMSPPANAQQSPSPMKSNNPPASTGTTIAESGQLFDTSEKLVFDELMLKRLAFIRKTGFSLPEYSDLVNDPTGIWKATFGTNKYYLLYRKVQNVSGHYFFVSITMEGTQGTTDGGYMWLEKNNDTSSCIQDRWDLAHCDKNGIRYDIAKNVLTTHGDRNPKTISYKPTSELPQGYDSSSWQQIAVPRAKEQLLTAAKGRASAEDALKIE